MLFVYDKTLSQIDDSAVSVKISHQDAVEEVVYSIVDMDGNKKYFSAAEIVDEDDNVVYSNAVLEVFGFAESFNGNLLIFTAVGSIEYVVEGWDHYYVDLMKSANDEALLIDKD